MYRGCTATIENSHHERVVEAEPAAKGQAVISVEPGTHFPKQDPRRHDLYSHSVSEDRITAQGAVLRAILGNGSDESGLSADRAVLQKVG